MAIEIKSGPAPIALRQGGKHKFLDIYEAAQKLGPKQWFEWPDPPKAMTAHRKKMKEINPKLMIFRSTNERVIVKNDAEPVTLAGTAVSSVAPSAVNDIRPNRATPLAMSGAGLTREQREAAAARVRQNGR